MLRGVLLLVAVGLPIATAIPLASEWTSGGPPSVGATVPVSHTPPLAGACLNATSTTAFVQLSLSNYDQRAQTLSVDVSVCLSLETLKQLRATSPGHQRVTVSEGTPLSLAFLAQHALPAFSRVPVYVDYVSFPPRAPSTSISNVTDETVLQTSFGRVARASVSPGDGSVDYGGYVPVGRLVLPVAQESARYPLDWYATLGSLSVGLGGPHLAASPIALPKDQEKSGLLPERIIVVQGANISPLVVRGGLRPDGSEGQIMFELVRSGRTKWFVLAVLSIPLILALLLATVLFVSGPSTSDRDALLGITAALLAVLPIRAVLVPPDLPSLTLVDYILGVEMAVLLAVACVVVLRNLPSSAGTSQMAVRR